MSGVNMATLLGRLGQDPEIRELSNGKKVANVSIATSESWKDKTSGEKVEKTEWHRLVFYGRLAEIVGDHLVKGRQIYVRGRLQTRKWRDEKLGIDRWSTEIIVAELQMLGGPARGNSNEKSADKDIPF